jgi:hypothetical protein
MTYSNPTSATCARTGDGNGEGIGESNGSGDMNGTGYGAGYSTGDGEASGHGDGKSSWDDTSADHGYGTGDGKGKGTNDSSGADDMRYGRCDAIRRMTCAHEPAVTTGSAAGEPTADEPVNLPCPSARCR